MAKRGNMPPQNSRTVNIEQGMPSLPQAVKILERELAYAREDHIYVLKIIHGYGSSGSGGKLRVGLRRYLQTLFEKRQIRYFLPGEEFSIFNQESLQIFGLCPEFSHDPDLGRANNGVTFIVLRKGGGAR